MDPSLISYCKIFPGFNIARLGNSPAEFFVGPEAPGVVPDVSGSYKDDQGRVKRQAARFRVYAFDESGQVVSELTLDHPDVAEIVWTVTLANKKAQWHGFAGTKNVAAILAQSSKVSKLRNLQVPDPERRKLIIGPATATISGVSAQSEALEGRFLSKQEKIALGQLRTDEAGRLLVLGGSGDSDTVLPDNPLAHYANNDGWYDDTADGPVTVVITMKNGDRLRVLGRGWVIVAPPHFSPHTQSVVTLYDVMTETAVEHDLPWQESEVGPRPAEGDAVSFSRNVFPILRCLVMYQWVSDRARRGHARGKHGDFLAPEVLSVLADPAQARLPASLHGKIFSRLRTPLLHPPLLGSRPPRDWELDPRSQEAVNQAQLYYMPPVAGDEGDVTPGDPEKWFSLTALQYRQLERWSMGDFINDWSGKAAAPSLLGEIPLADQPAALTRASLEACQGGAFFPGIEMTSIARFPSFYSEAFRAANAELEAGDITRWMAVPWQADFYECRDHWWPAIRPDDVIPSGEYAHILKSFPQEAAERNLSSLLVVRKPWDRGIGRVLPDRPGLPALTGSATAAEYQTVARSQLDGFIQGFLRVVPQPLDNEVATLYQRRLEEFLFATVLSPGKFKVPRPKESEDLEAYYERVRGAIDTFLQGETDLPEPGAGESATSYHDRLAELAAGKVSWQGLFGVEWRRRVRHREKNDMAKNWSHLGFIAATTAFGETVYVETDRGRYDMLTFRDYFYYLMNLEDNDDFLPTARQLADDYLRQAAAVELQVRVDPTQEEYGFFVYDPVTFRARLEKIYEKQRREAEAYNPATGENEPLFRTPGQVVERIRQLAPFNQLDGSWLERAAHAGPIDEVRSALFEIWSDEIGNGDPAQSHANVYTDLLHSAGIYLPPLASSAYSANPDIWDSSFSSPVYQTAIAHFPETYFPELLGMTLYLEWEAVYLPAMVKLYEYHGYNALFYRLHVAIDNPVNGHGARARDAVILYLDHIRDESGEAGVQEHWRRVWMGYLAFKYIGGSDWRYFFSNPPTAEDRAVDMIAAKRHYAQLNHGDRRFGANYINDWFDEPGDFLNELVESELITKGDAKNSRFFGLLSFMGPMLKVFSAKDKQVLSDWINSLPADPTGSDLDPGEAMAVLLRKLAPRSEGVPDHHDQLLVGKYVDPAKPEEEQEVTKPVQWWFRIGQPDRLMAALSNPKNGWIVPGNVAESRFVRELLAEPRRMARFLIGEIAEVGDKPARQVIIEWIQAGCPIPKRAPARMTLAIPFSANVSAAVGGPVREEADEYSREIQGQTKHSARLTVEQNRGLRRRRYGPGGGAPH
jgi:L-Lysine epsilon oxidase N-terminal/L-lysine epsilon oxidase C-terminal domain/Iron-containing redox enzyme